MTCGGRRAAAPPPTWYSASIFSCGRKDVFFFFGGPPSESGSTVPAPPQAFGCVDVEADGGAGALVDTWDAGERRLVDECTLVPMRTDGGKEGDERACWLLAPIFDGATRTSSYVVLDGRDLARGPVCEWALETFIPWGLHGNWRAGEPARAASNL